MRFAVIAPAAGLRIFASQSRTHLLLAHVKNEFYWQFYAQLRVERPDDLIIMDNGVYEGQCDMDLAVRRGRQVGANVLVMPDLYKGYACENFQQAAGFIRNHRHKLPFDLMYVPQFEGSVSDYHLMRQGIRDMMDLFGVRWFGLPRCIGDMGYSRPELCIWIKRLHAEWDPLEPIYVHALGMRAGSLSEQRELDRAQCDSIDSSAPVWRGWNGFDIEAEEAWRKNGTECDFDADPNSLTPENHNLIISNLRKVGVNVKC